VYISSEKSIRIFTSALIIIILSVCLRPGHVTVSRYSCWWGVGGGVVLAYLYVLSSMYVSWGGGKRWVGVGGGGCVLSGKGTAA
jgi:hypothetical protein